MEEERDIYILGIESSCDDTSAAVLRNGVLLSNVTASQDVHKLMVALFQNSRHVHISRMWCLLLIKQSNVQG